MVYEKLNDLAEIINYLTKFLIWKDEWFSGNDQLFN